MRRLLLLSQRAMSAAQAAKLRLQERYKKEEESESESEDEFTEMMKETLEVQLCIVSLVWGSIDVVLTTIVMPLCLCSHSTM